MNTTNRISVTLYSVLIAAQGFSLAGVVSRGNYDFVCNIVGSTLFWLAYIVYEYIYKLRINYYIRLVVVIAIISDSFFGFYLNYYVTSQVFDRIQHIFGTYALALFFCAILKHFMQETVSIRWIQFIFVVAIGISVGNLYEVMEFVADTLMKPQILNQPSLQDTDLDLISNTIGAVLAGIHSMYTNLGNQRKHPL